jgi:elongation factor Ts
MMECKKALVATGGDIEVAMDEMRKSGQAKADKKAGRVAAEGVVLVRTSADGKRALLLEINSETDFVARDDTFTAFANDAADIALEKGLTSVEALSEATLASGQTVEETRQATIAKIGENVKLRRISIVETDGLVGSYVHSGRIGVLVELKGGDEALARDLAMHVAASGPVVVSRDQVPQDLVEKEKEIFTAQAKESGKPDAIIEKMITGRINKFLDEVSLLGQGFIKDPNQKVQNLLKEKGADVISFIRLEVGEGIEKKEDNFVEEVMAQVK